MNIILSTSANPSDPGAPKQGMATSSGSGPLRPTPAALGALWSAETQTLGERVRLVPRTQEQWVWAPTSGNCFRRDALHLFSGGDRLADLRSQTDLFLALGVNAICGSMLIDEPLFAYRLHGANTFTNRPQLQGVLSFDVKRSSDTARTARRLILELMTEHIDRFVPEPGMGRGFLAALARCDVAVSEPGTWHGRSTAARAVALRFDKVARAIGAGPAWRFLARQRAPVPVLMATAARMRSVGRDANV